MGSINSGGARLAYSTCFMMRVEGKKKGIEGGGGGKDDDQGEMEKEASQVETRQYSRVLPAQKMLTRTSGHTTHDGLSSACEEKANLACFSFIADLETNRLASDSNGFTTCEAGQDPTAGA